MKLAQRIEMINGTHFVGKVAIVVWRGVLRMHTRKLVGHSGSKRLQEKLARIKQSKPR